MPNSGWTLALQWAFTPHVKVHNLQDLTKFYELTDCTYQPRDNIEKGQQCCMLYTCLGHVNILCTNGGLCTNGDRINRARAGGLTWPGPGD